MNIEQMTPSELADKLNGLCVAEFAWPYLNKAATELRRLAARDAQWNALIAGQAGEAVPDEAEVRLIAQNIRELAQELALEFDTGDLERAADLLEGFAPQAVQADMLETLRRARPYVLHASTSYYDGTGGAAKRQSARGVLKRIDEAIAAAPSPDGKAEQEEAPSDLSVLRRIHKLLVNQVRPALRSPVITKDVDDAAEALSALMSRTQTEAPSDSTLKLAEMILADCGHSTAISTRLRDRVAERIERHLAAQPTEASCRSTNADGHVLLPFEPTDEMEVAAEDAYEESGSPFPNWKAVYRAMRDAAPSPDGKAEQALASSDPEGHRQAITDHEAEQAEASSENQRNDSVVDRYLRNNLDDDDYAAFSAALGCLYAPQAEAPSDAAREVLAAGIVHHYGVPEEASFACARRVLALASKPTAGPEQAEAPSDADPLTPEQEEWVMDLAEKHNLGRRVPQIGAMRGVAPDVFYTDASYRTHELFCFAAALLSTKELT